MAIDESTLLKNIKMLDNNTISISNLTNKLCVMLSKMGYNRTEELENSISIIITKYKEKQISGDEFVSMFNTITASSNNNTPVNNNNRTGSKPTTNNTEKESNQKDTKPETKNTENDNNKETKNTIQKEPMTTTPTNTGSNSGSNGDIVEIDTDTTAAATADLQNVESTIESATLDVPPKVQEFAPSLESDAEAAKENVNSEVNELKESIVEAVNAVQEVDDEIPKLDVGKSLQELVATAYDVSQNRAAQRATEEFFRNGGATINGNFAILNVDGQECKYDMKKHKFYVNGKYAFDAEFFVPSGVTNYSQCNTYTYFCSSSNDYKDVINKRNTNSVVLKITKYSEKVHFDKYSEVATATKFTNQVAKTDLNNCQNVIGGDSVYGAHSLKIAAKSGDLYQTVYCVDNAALVTDINARRNNKEQFSTIEELKGLDGKNVIFMSASGDDNLACHYGNSTMTKCPYDQSYTYTGVKLLCETCPNAKVSFIYQPTKSYQNQIAALYKDLENKYSNFSYDTSAWDSYARKRYEYHSGGNYIVSDLAEAPATNVNRYNAII